MLMSMTGFKHKITSAYHPQSNGLDERLNQTLKASLQKVVNDQQDDWDQLVDNVLFAYRTSRQGSTKFTPFYLMYGREAKLPIDTCISLQSGDAASDEEAEQQTVELSLEDKITKLTEVQKKVHDVARKNIKKAQERQKEQYDKKHNIGKPSLKVHVTYKVT